MNNADERKPKIVLLGMMSRMPVAGMTWLDDALPGRLRRLGYDLYYVEAHARTPSMLMRAMRTTTPRPLAAAFIADVMRRFDFGDRWAFHALHDDGRCLRPERSRAARALRDRRPDHQPARRHRPAARALRDRPADLPGNRSGAAADRAVQQGSGRDRRSWRRIAPSSPWARTTATLTARCRSRSASPFYPTRRRWCSTSGSQPAAGGDAFTTIGNWQQNVARGAFPGRGLPLEQAPRVHEVPRPARRTSAAVRAGLSSYDRGRRRSCSRRHGWRVGNALDFSTDIDAYRDYIQDSRGEFTVAKDQNVRLRSGWFSDRSAAYLASGRPVITQETGFSNILPTGEGLFAFETGDDVLAAIDALRADYPGHVRAARAIAEEILASDRVLTGLLQRVGVAG